jgi:hypothetical protein
MDAVEGCLLPCLVRYFRDEMIEHRLAEALKVVGTHVARLQQANLNIASLIEEGLSAEVLEAVRRLLRDRLDKIGGAAQGMRSVYVVAGYRLVKQEEMKEDYELVLVMNGFNAGRLRKLVRFMDK